MMGGGYYGGEWFTPVISIVLIGLAIVAVIALLRNINRRDRIQSVSVGENSAIEILKKRYASGDINKDEYEQKKKDLL
jgi:putative membrane protein